MGDTIRGRGLFTADAILSALADDPERLGRARNRFSSSPPPYRSHLSSGTTTRSQSPDAPNEAEYRREMQRRQLIKEYEVSLPREQFAAQRYEEEQRIHRAKAKENGSLSLLLDVPLAADSDVINLAKERVKKCWVEQGIWIEKWKDMDPCKIGRPSGPWKHKLPLELESESESESEAGGDALPFLFSQTKNVKRRRPKSDEELRLIAERRVVHEREREASRPFYQFFHQVSKERARMQHESRFVRPAHAASDPADINTKAYDNVKNTWIERGIWSTKWGTLPGMCWKHEQPRDEMLMEEMGPDPVPCQADLSRASVPAQIFGGPSVVDANTRPPPRGKKSQKDGNAEPMADTVLGPIRPARVSKASTRGKRSGPRRGIASDARPPPLEPPPVSAPVPLRRSKRSRKGK